MKKKLVVICLMICFMFLQGLIISQPVAAGEYIVQPGDTLTHIARRYGTTVEAIVVANNIADPDLIIVGQVLDIPSPSLSAGPPKPIYTGQTLSSGFDLGVDSSHGRSDWVTDMGGHICMNYPTGQEWGAVFITVGEPKSPPRPGQNFSGFDTLSVELRGETGGEFVSLGIKDGSDPDDGSETKIQVSNLTTEWQTFTFPLSAFTTADLSNLYVVTEFVFEAGTPAESICFRNIQYLPDETGTTSAGSFLEQIKVADFDSCAGINNLDGQMGAAYQSPHNQLTEGYVAQTNHGCAARLTYQIRDWGAFWLKLNNLDLSLYRQFNGVLTFDIKAEEPIPNGVQIELKRLCLPNEGCGELSVYYMTGITSDWQTRSVPIEGFGSIGWAPPLSTWDNIEELVFTFAFPNAANNGTVYIDNIRFEDTPSASPIIPSTTSTTSQTACVGDSSAQLTQQAWNALNSDDLVTALACTQETIQRYSAQADTQQATRIQQGICFQTPNPNNQAQIDAYWASYWAVNDVATSWFIRGEALRQQGEDAQARESYQTVIDRYSCAHAFDPGGPWFWRVAEAAQEKLN